jgi:hypothetical protein
MNESLILREIVQRLELGNHPLFSIDDLSRFYRIKRRGLYDLINICSGFGICRRAANGSIEWIGLRNSSNAVGAIRRQATDESTKGDLFARFDYSVDSSLSRISVAVIRLFFCLGAKTLDLRKVAKLFSQGKAKYKTMLRKLYTAASGLELSGLVRRTAVVSEIRLNSPIQSQPTSSQLCVSSILNTPEELATTIEAERLRREFEAIAVESIYDPS